MDISYCYTYLGHPLKLIGVWTYIILGDFTGATPTNNLRFCDAGGQSIGSAKEHQPDKGILKTHITAQYTVHNLAYLVYQDSCVDQGLPRLVGTQSAALGHLS